jgi:hypothetical protein
VAYVQENSIIEHLFKQCPSLPLPGEVDQVTHGWIKLHRRLLKNHIFDNPRLLKTFLWCLLKASHKEHTQMVGRQKVLLRPGQFVTGRTKSSEALNMSPSTAWAYLKLLEDDKTIEIQSTTKFSIVTITNWRMYQSRDNKPDSNEEPFEQESNHEFGADPDNRRTANDQQGVNSKDMPLKQEFEQETEGNLDNKCDKKADSKPDSKHKPTEQGFNQKAEGKSDSKPDNRRTANGQQMDTNKNDENDENKYVYTHIFEHWNSKDIIKHRSLNDRTKGSINAKLKDYTSEEICQAIDNYAAIVHDDRYYFTYRWTLQEFLQRGFETFLTWEVAHQNYLKDEIEAPQGGEKKCRLLEDELRAQTLI